jgi:hydroxypyruvate reductase
LPLPAILARGFPFSCYDQPYPTTVATCSVGHDHIDIPAARARGVLVTNTPEVVTEATADMALLLMLGADFHGKTLGIIGMGRIGLAVAKRARGFGLNIVYHSRRRLPADVEAGLDTRFFEDIGTMLPYCQILSLHLPGSAEFDGYFDARTLSRLPRGAVLVNTSRGSLVNEDDLIKALQAGHLAAAGLDVFRQEPACDLRLKDLPNVFMMPHMGAATIETRVAMGYRALDNVADLLAGHTPRDTVR